MRIKICVLVSAAKGQKGTKAFDRALDLDISDIQYYEENSL